MSAQCRHCGTEIVQEPRVGWVDAVSGDEGGTYDRCPEGPGRHEPDPADRQVQ